jgi:uncharacterized protein (TIGR04222 family)
MDRIVWELFIIGLPVLLVAGGWLSIALLLRKRDAREVVVRFSPPSDITPGEAGLLMRGTPSAVDTAGTLIDLSVRGYLRMEPDGRDTVVSVGRPPDDTLRPHEHALLYRLFDETETVRLSEFPTTMAYAVDEVNRALVRSALRRRWYRFIPTGWFLRRAGGALAGLVLVGGLGLFLGLLQPGAALGGWLIVTASGLIATPIVLAWLLSRRRGRLPAGYAAYREVAGFKRYLEIAEANQLRFEEAGDVYARYLPWAIVFGLTTRWTHICEDLEQRGVLWVPDPDRQGLSMPWSGW